MKTFASIAALAASSLAFPHLNSDVFVEKRATPPQGSGYLPLSPPPFDAKLQYVSNKGANAFVAPGPNDERGPCPGLNAAANHGYLPHNGKATITQFIQGTAAVFGMAADLSGFLAVYGAVVDGDGTSWSIGGVPHTGISGSHHNYEADSSPLKADLNQYGSNVRTINSQFFRLYNMQPNATTANYNLDVMSDFRYSRLQESIAKNPYFFYGPFDGIAVSQAAFTFIYRFMSNKSAEFPEGRLNKAVLKSFMSYSGPENNLTHTPGYERIPDNWYKRHPSDQYSIPYLASDIKQFSFKYPEIFSIGCNTGTVNSYQHIGFDTLLGVVGIGKDPLCATLNYVNASGKGLLDLSDSRNTQLQQAVSKVASSLSCTLSTALKPDWSLVKSCPGFTIYGGPTGPVAPGAIQS